MSVKLTWPLSICILLSIQTGSRLSSKPAVTAAIFWRPMLRFIPLVRSNCTMFVSPRFAAVCLLNLMTHLLHLLFCAEEKLNDIRGTLTAAIELTGCSSISPVLRRLLYGSTCTRSVEGLTWLWTTLLAMTIVGLLVMSTRAAFYNPVIRGRRGKRREKEFDDYKLYMSKYYDTANWELDLIPDMAEDKKDGEKSDEETYSTSGGITPSASEEAEESSSDPGLVPAVVSSTDGSTFLNLAVPVKDTGGGDKYSCPSTNNNNEDADDDDSDYDSTYSYDSNDDLHSTSTASVFSMIFQKRRQRHQDRLQQDDLQSNTSSSSSSVFARFLPHWTPGSTRSKANKNMQSLKTSTEIPYAQQVQSSFLNNGFFEEEDSDEDGSVDSMVGVLLTPPADRYPQSRLIGSGLRNPGFRVRDDPDGIELEPLTPSPQQQQLASPRHSTGRDPIGRITEIS